MSLREDVEKIAAAMNENGDATRYGVTNFRNEQLWKLASEVRRNGPEGVDRVTILKLFAAEHLLESLPEEETDQ